MEECIGHEADQDCSVDTGSLDTTSEQPEQMASHSLEDMRHPHGKKSFPNVLELKDIDGGNFYAYEDPDMIRWLGREKFIEVLRFSPTGWVKNVKGGNDKTLRIYKCTMTHTRYKCQCLYTEMEYEKLALEAHMDSKHENLVKGWKGRGRPPFMCIYCSLNFKDKNTLSWHRMRTECLEYIGKTFLKMYPTWDKGDMKELQRIKHNMEIKDTIEFATQTKRQGKQVDKGKSKKLKYTQDKEMKNTLQDTKVFDKEMKDTMHGSKVKDKEMKDTTQGRKVQDKAMKDTMHGRKVQDKEMKDTMHGSKVKDKEMKDTIHDRKVQDKEMKDTLQGRKVTQTTKELQYIHETRTTNQGGVPKIVIEDVPIPSMMAEHMKTSKGKDKVPMMCQKMLVEDIMHGQKVLPTSRPSQQGLKMSTSNQARVLKVIEKDNVQIEGMEPEKVKKKIKLPTLQQEKNSSVPKTQLMVEVAASMMAMTFTLEEHASLRPEPQAVPLNGMALVIYETGEVVDHDLQQNLEGTMELLLSLHANGTIVQKLKFAFGHWYINDTPKDLNPVTRTEKLYQEITRSLKVFDHHFGGVQYIDVFEEMRQIGAYLTYRHDFDKYMLEKAEAQRTLEDLRTKYINKELHEFNMRCRLEEEERQWKWSPLYAVLKSSPPPEWPQAPWNHTSDELDNLLLAWESQEQNGKLSLEKECPHILRALKLTIRQTYGTSMPLGHPKVGLTMDTVLALTKSTCDSTRLIVAAEDFVKHGWVFFPTLPSSVEPISQCRADLLCLLGNAEEPKERVVQKIDAFVKRLALRALLDLQKTGHRCLLDTMWHRNGSTEEEKIFCHQVFSDALTLREDIDLGWVFVGEKTTGQSVTPENGVVQDCTKALMDVRDSQLHALESLRGKEASSHQKAHDIDVEDTKDELSNYGETDFAQVDCSAIPSSFSPRIGEKFDSTSRPRFTSACSNHNLLVFEGKPSGQFN